MNSEKIGNLIKDLRMRSNLSQEDLAKELFIDRSVISKWESGKRIPDLKYLVKMSEIFNVSLDELVYGEMNNQNNQGAVKKNFLDYLVDQNDKYRRSKITSLFLVLVVILIGISFLAYYFYETYNKTQVYKLGGFSDDFVFTEGFLITTREKSYLKIGEIKDRLNNQIYTNDIKLIYKNNDKEIQVYKGTPDKILIDFYGYDSIINAKNIEDLKNNLYININDEIIKLSFKTNFTNDDVLFDNLIETLGNNIDDKNNNIPTRIREEFILGDDVYSLKIDNIRLDYIISNSTFYITDENNNLKIDYIIPLKEFIYNDNNGNSFIVENNEINCMSNSCHDEQEIYNEYYNNYIKKYIYE